MKPLFGGFFVIHRAVGGRFWGDGNPLTEGQPPKDGWIIVAPGWLAYLGLVVEGRVYRRSAVV